MLSMNMSPLALYVPSLFIFSFSPLSYDAASKTGLVFGKAGFRVAGLSRAGHFLALA